MFMPANVVIMNNVRIVLTIVKIIMAILFQSTLSFFFPRLLQYFPTFRCANACLTKYSNITAKALGEEFFPLGPYLTTSGLTNLQSTILQFPGSISVMFSRTLSDNMSFQKTGFSNVASLGGEYHKLSSTCTRTGSARTVDF